MHLHERAGDESGGSTHETIELHVAELRQLFNSMDPSPFRKRDLDVEAEEFIVGWAREAPRDVHFKLLVHLDEATGQPEESAFLREAVHLYFTHRAAVTMRRLHQLLRNGRTSLFIGVVSLTVSLVLSDLCAKFSNGRDLGELLKQSLLIGGWVAMWRPLEIFLYGWWPIRAEHRLLTRLAVMPVQVAKTGAVRGNGEGAGGNGV